MLLLKYEECGEKNTKNGPYISFLPLLLQVDFTKATATKTAAEDAAVGTSRRMKLAERLSNGLAAEKERYCIRVPHITERQ